MLLVILKAKKMLKRFAKKNCEKCRVEKGCRVEKVRKRKGMNYSLNRKAMIILSKIGFIKKT